MPRPTITYPASLRFDVMGSGWAKDISALGSAYQAAQPPAVGLFGGKDPRAIAWAHEHAAELLTINGMTGTHPLCLILRGALTEAMQADLSYKQIQALLRETYGFSKEEANLISCVEVGLAQCHGSLAGAISVGMRVKKWLLSNDTGVCAGCAANAAQGWIAIGQPFASGALAPLDHTGCRCDAAYRRSAT